MELLIEKQRMLLYHPRLHHSSISSNLNIHCHLLSFILSCGPKEITFLTGIFFLNWHTLTSFISSSVFPPYLFIFLKTPLLLLVLSGRHSRNTSYSRAPVSACCPHKLAEVWRIFSIRQSKRRGQSVLLSAKVMPPSSSIVPLPKSVLDTWERQVGLVQRTK